MADSPEEKGRIDIDKILLPKKEADSPDSAQRINAGALLEQEQLAAGAKPADGAQGGALESPGVKASPLGSAVPPAQGISPLQTYRSDIEKVIEQKNASVVSVAAAEAEKRAAAPSSLEKSSDLPSSVHTPAGQTFLGRTALVLGGIALLAAAGGIIYFVLTRDTSVPIAGQLQAPFMFVDKTSLVEVAQSDSRGTLVQSLEAARTNVKLSLGLVERLYPARPSALPEGIPQLLTAPELLAVLAPHVPDTLARTLEPAYLLGVHSFDENQPFLILRVDSYEQGFSGMLAWERTMQADLAPLFARKAPIHVEAVQATSTASSTPPFIPTQFVDRIVENRDARVIQNNFGDILLLWTFLSRNTVLITTNEYTLREIISRLSTAPLVPLAQ